MRKARALNDQRKEEYRKVQSSTNRSQEEQSNGGNKQLEKKRKLEEEAMQKVRKGTKMRQFWTNYLELTGFINYLLLMFLSRPRKPSTISKAVGLTQASGDWI